TLCSPHAIHILPIRKKNSPNMNVRKVNYRAPNGAAPTPTSAAITARLQFRILFSKVRTKHIRKDGLPSNLSGVESEASPDGALELGHRTYSPRATRLFWRRF